MLKKEPQMQPTEQHPPSTASVALVTAVELQADGPTVPVTGLQLTAITEALLKDCIACHLLGRGPAAYLWLALAAEPSGSPAHTCSPWMQE